jgi:hypothetical protein
VNQEPIEAFAQEYFPARQRASAEHTVKFSTGAGEHRCGRPIIDRQGPGTREL